MPARDAVAIIGSGLMGPGIAACSVLAGHRTKLCDRTIELARSGLEKTREHIHQLRESGIVDADRAARAVALLTPLAAQDAGLDDVFWVVEAITEDLAAKQELFARLDSALPTDVIVTSNTSGLRITDIARLATHPERMATTHFWFPAHLVPLVEVVMSDRTDERVAEQLRRWLLEWGKAPVVVRKDLPGQLANRILQAVIREAIHIVEVGLASPEDVDTAVKMGMGIRMPAWGPLEHIEAVGLDLALSVQKNVLPAISSAVEPSPYLRGLVAAGNLGHKSGAGFYDWGEKDMQALKDRRDRFIIEALKILRG